MRFIYFCIALMFVFVAMPANSEEIWQDLTSNLKDVDLNTIAVSPQNPDIVYCGSSKAVYRSTNGGENWSQVLSIKGEAKAINFISIHPRDSRLIFVATENGLFKSNDGGMQWRRIFSGMGELERSVSVVTLHPKNYHDIYIGTQRGLFWSIDGGDSWYKGKGVPGESRVIFVAISPANYELVYVATTSGVFRGGRAEGWERVFVTSSELESSSNDEEIFSSPELVTGITFNPTNPQNLYLATHNGLFTSYDGGVSWNKLSKVGLTSGDIRFILTSRQNSHLLYAATNRGVFEFSANLNQWRELYQGITSPDVRSLSLDKKRSLLWAATERGVFRVTLDNSQELSPPSFTSLKAKNILNYFASEPPVGEIQEVAVKYAEVHPEKIARWREQAAKKALLPELKIGVDGSISETYEIYTSSTKNYYVLGPEDTTYGWDISLTWKLGDLIWNDDQTSIDTRSKLMVQLRDDILDEVTRLYFQRRRLQVELLMSPPADIKERIEKELRLQELTADIDALTGGYLSEKVEK